MKLSVRHAARTANLYRRAWEREARGLEATLLGGNRIRAARYDPYLKSVAACETFTQLTLALRTSATTQRHNDDDGQGAAPPYSLPVPRGGPLQPRPALLQLRADGMLVP